MITRKNYELYFIDYLEGNLSEEEIAMVDIFLEENVDLKEELTEFSSASTLEPVETIKMDFSHLKKESLIDEQNEDEFFIGKIEGDLNEEQLKALSLYLVNNSEKKAVLTSFEKTKITPEVIMFPNKQSLKQHRKIGFYYYLTTAVAASILALLYFNISFDGGITVPLTAQKNKYKIEIKEVKEPVIEIEKEKEEPIIRNQNAVVSPENVKLNSEQKGTQENITPREKIEIENINSKIIEVKMIEEQKLELLAMNPVLVNPEIKEKPTEEKLKSIEEFAKIKALSFIEEKVTGKKDNTESLFAFATKKASKIPLPRFIDYDTQKTVKQEVKTIKIGNIFTIKRKSNN